MKKPFLIIFSVFVVLGIGYWIKCQNDIDLISNWHLGDILPVQTLHKHVHSITFAKVSSNPNGLSTKNKSDWHKLWMREEDSAICEIKDGRIVITSKCVKDWSLSHSELIETRFGDKFAFSGRGKIGGKDAHAVLGVVLYDKEKKVIKWHHGAQKVNVSGKWELVKGEFVIPQGVGFICFRLTGDGIGKFQFDDLRFIGKHTDSLEESLLVLENAYLKFSFDSKAGSIGVLDRRAAKQWKARTQFLVKDVLGGNRNELLFSLVDPETAQEYRVKIGLVKDSPEITWEVSQGVKKSFEWLEFPPVFEISNNAEVVLPRSEGMLVNIEQLRRDFRSNFRYGGGWPISFLGVLDAGQGWMEIIETPNDFEVFLAKDEAAPFANRWISQKGEFGYSRKIRFVFFDKANYVGMAKQYRQYAKTQGLVVRLDEKDAGRKNNISKLIGAVNVWYWGIDKFEFAQELKKSGIFKCLFSNTDKWDVAKINKLGFLTSHYDIYQDVWPPIYHDVTHAYDGWPEDLVSDKSGNWIKGWSIMKGLKEYPGGVICSIPGLERAKRQITNELEEEPYTARFIDTTTASGWRECYNGNHPTNRTEDIKNKMALLGLCSRELGLVTGSEDGVECAVPYADYFEGMMSPGIGRLPGSGRGVDAVSYMQPTENFLCYGVGEKYRTPLWQLVYGDCAVATWYWDDSSNRIPEVWWRKDLLNILYGNMPLWAIRDYDHWKRYKKRFIESYNNVCPVFEKVGFLEMLSHRFVTEDRIVQETQFEGDIRIFVNFNEESPFKLKEFNYILPAKGFVVFENGKVWKEGACS